MEQTIVKSTQAALIFNKSGEIQLCLPKGRKNIPRELALAAALFLKLDDVKFRESIFSQFDALINAYSKK